MKWWSTSFRGSTDSGLRIARKSPTCVCNVMTLCARVSTLGFVTFISCWRS
jgi:hypothetical protein